MRPGLGGGSRAKHTVRPLDVPLPSVIGTGPLPPSPQMMVKKSPMLALPPIPSHTPRATSSEGPGSDANEATAAGSPAAPSPGHCGSLVPSPPAAPIRLANGALVPAITLNNNNNSGGSMVVADPAALGVGSTTTKALTARKPTDSDAGRLSKRLQLIASAKAQNMGPLSQFPVHGGASLSRSPAAACARPPLAVELETFIRRELNLLLRQTPTTDPLAKIAIGREAFGAFICHFPEFATTLELIKRLYDDVVEDAFKQRHQRHALETENIGFRDYHRTVLEKEKADAKKAATDAQSTVDSLQALLDRQTMRQKETELELHRMANQLTERTRQLEEAEARAVLFERGVVELTDKGVAVQHRLTNARRENERLHQNIDALEQQLRENELAISQGFAVSQRRATRSKSIAAGALIAAGSSPPGMANSVVKFATPSSPAGSTGSPTQRPPPGTGGSNPPGPAPVSAFATAAPPTNASFGMAFDPLGGGDDFDDGAEVERDPQEVVMELEGKLKKASRQVYLLTTERQALLQRIESLSANLEREKNEMTPRPPWTSVAEVLPGFALNSLATSEETLGDLIQHFKDELAEEKRDTERKALTHTVAEWLGQENLCESDLVGKHRFFVCKGTGEHVPVYLRARGVVRNRKLRKGDAEKLLSRFWADRRLAIRIESNLNVTALPDFLNQWLVQLTGSSKAAVEVAYNLLAVCEQYQMDPDCAMFLRILRGELSEHAMFDQQDMLANLHDTIVANDPGRKRFLSRFTIHRILMKFFPTKARQDMLRLRFALVLSCKGQTMVDYEALFSEDEDGNQSRFVEVIRRQHVEEATVFTVEVEEALREAVRDDGKIDLNNARMALKHLDPAMPNSRIEDVMAFGCGMTLSEMERYGQYFAVEAEPFLARLRRGVLLRRYSRRMPAEGEDDSDDRSSDSDADGQEAEEQRELQRAAEMCGEVTADIVIPESQLRKAIYYSDVSRTMEQSLNTEKSRKAAATKQQQMLHAGSAPGSMGASLTTPPSSPGVAPSSSSNHNRSSSPAAPSILPSAAPAPLATAAVSGGSARASPPNSSPSPPAATVLSPTKIAMRREKDELKFLDAFTRKQQKAAKESAEASRRASRADGASDPPVAKRRQSMVEALTAKQPVTASMAFEAVNKDMDAIRPKAPPAPVDDLSGSTTTA